MWTYSPALPERRRALLNSAPPFEDLIERICAQMRIRCGHWQCCGDTQGQHRRRIYCVDVGHELFDFFFNGPTGYRARYFESPSKGLLANAKVLTALLPVLVADEVNDGSIGEIEASLVAPSAKVWLAEAEAHLCDECTGEWSPSQDLEPEILNGRWEKADHVKGRYGRKAYRFTKLRIFGGFLNAAGHEYVAEHKKHRAEHLYRYGWS